MVSPLSTNVAKGRIGSSQRRAKAGASQLQAAAAYSTAFGPPPRLRPARGTWLRGSLLATAMSSKLTLRSAWVLGVGTGESATLAQASRGTATAESDVGRSVAPALGVMSRPEPSLTARRGRRGEPWHFPDATFSRLACGGADPLEERLCEAHERDLFLEKVSVLPGSCKTLNGRRWHSLEAAPQPPEREPSGSVAPPRIARDTRAQADWPVRPGCWVDALPRGHFRHAVLQQCRLRLQLGMVRGDQHLGSGSS